VLDPAVCVPCFIVEGVVHLLSDYYNSNMLSLPHAYSRHLDVRILRIVNILYAVLGNNLEVNALEVDRQTALELLCAHAHDLQTLLVVDVRVVVLV
jgi:hypothetical protein